MNTPADFHKSVTVTVGLLIWIAAVSFSLGMIYKSIIDNDKEHVKLHEFVEQEVGGLRADWERRYHDDVKPRLENLEHKH